MTLRGAGSDGSERAVSEMVGFIIVIGIIVTSISMVYFNGVPALQNEREAQKVASVQTAFELFQGNLDQIMEGRADSRSTEISLAGDELEVREEPRHWVNVSIERPDGQELCPENMCRTSYKPLRYLSAENAVLYENGAVIRRSTTNGSAMASRPNWVHTEETLILPIIRTRGQGAAAGTTTVSVFAEKTSESSRVVRNASGLDVMVNVTTQRPVAWRTFGDRHGNVTVDYDRSDVSRVTIEIDGVTRVIHSKKVVELTFI